MHGDSVDVHVLAPGRLGSRRGQNLDAYSVVKIRASMMRVMHHTSPIPE